MADQPKPPETDKKEEDPELKELERQKKLAQARAELAEQQKKQLAAEQALADLLNPQKSESQKRLDDIKAKQEELEATKKLFPGTDLTLAGASVTLGDGAYIDNEVDGAMAAQELANRAAKAIRDLPSPKITEVVVLEPKTAELFLAYRNVDSQLAFAEQTFRSVEKAAEEARSDVPKAAASLALLETAGVALSLFYTIGKSAAAISELFKTSREVKNPVALSQFTRELELALYGNLAAGHAPSEKPPQTPQKITVRLPAFLALGEAPPLAGSSLFQRREGARKARDEAQRSLEVLEVKDLAAEEEKALRDQGLTEEEIKARLEAKAQELGYLQRRLKSQAQKLRTDFQNAVSLLEHVEALLFGKNDAPDAKPIVDGLLAVDQMFQAVQGRNVPFLVVQGLAAGARNEIKKGRWTSPRWSRSAGGVVGVALYQKDGTLLWAQIFSGKQDASE